MKFEDFFKEDDLAYSVLGACIDIVFEGGDGCEEFIDRLSKEARLVYLVGCFDGEIHNGGFMQFFDNSISNHYQEILKSLEYLGAKHSIRLLLKAIDLFPNSKPSSDRYLRAEQVDVLESSTDYEAKLEALDEEFYEYKDNLSSLVTGFIRGHAGCGLRA